MDSERWSLRYLIARKVATNGLNGQFIARLRLKTTHSRMGELRKTRFRAARHFLERRGVAVHGVACPDLLCAEGRCTQGGMVGVPRVVSRMVHNRVVRWGSPFLALINQVLTGLTESLIIAV